MNDRLREAIFGLGPHVRYVAFGAGQQIELAQRDGLAGASEAGSDHFEELLVNPAILLLTRQRGELDCGGLRFVVVAYGNFHQIVMPAGAGHVSVCVERDADPIAAAEQVAGLVADAIG